MATRRATNAPGLAVPSLGALYDSLQDTLQISWVPEAFSALAEVPSYLRLAWEALRPSLKTAQFVRLAERIEKNASAMAQELYAPDYGPGDLQQLGVPLDQQAEIRSALSALVFEQTQTLLAVTALRLAIEGNPPGGVRRTSWPRSTTTWTLQPIPVLDEASAGERIRRIFAEARQVLDHPVVPRALRVIARRPRYAQLAWDDLEAVLEQPAFEAVVADLREESIVLCSRLPSRVEATVDNLVSAGVSQFELRRAQEILQSYDRYQPSNLLLTSCLRLPLGGNRPSSRGWHPAGGPLFSSYP